MITILALSFAGAIIAIVVSSFWYSDRTPMGKIHRKFLGLDGLSPEELENKMKEGKALMPKMYAAQIILSLMTSFAVVFITLMSMRIGVPFSVTLEFIALNWLCFMVPAIGSGILWSACDRRIAWKKFFSDISVNLIVIVATAYVASFFA